METKEASFRAAVAALVSDARAPGQSPNRDDNPCLRDIVNDAKVAVFLHNSAELTTAITDAGARQIVHFIRDAESREPQSGASIVRPYLNQLQVRENNAEVLILDGVSVLAAYQIQNLAHARFILSPSGPIGQLLRVMLLHHREIRYCGKIKIGDGSWLVFEGTRKRRGFRRYVSTEGGMQEIAESLSGLRYSVLRWHRLLANLENLNDLDLLVHNEDLHELGRRLDAKFGFFPVDVKTAFFERGKRGGRVYFPAERAFELLDRSILGCFGERRPAPRDTLLSFSYHLLFQKPIGHLGSDDELLPQTWSHPRFLNELLLLCDEAGVERFVRLCDLETLLSSEGWFPPRDMLGKISRRNAFVRHRYYEHGEYTPGLALFVLRDVAVRRGITNSIVDMLREVGFEIIAEGSVPENLRTEVALRWRGGDWTTPASREANGGPAYYAIALDPSPKPLSAIKSWLKKRYRNIDNRRLLLKGQIRTKASTLADGSRINALHSSDNTLEALEYIKIIRPDLYDELSVRFKYASASKH